MIIKKNFMKRALITVAAMVIAVVAPVNVIAASAQTKTLNTTEFGMITGNNAARKEYSEKCVCLSVKSVREAAHYVIRYNVTYNGSGESITGTVELMDVNRGIRSNSECYEDIEMHHWSNKMTGQRDGFLYTSITTYGTQEVRGTNAYAVYTSSTL